MDGERRDGDRRSGLDRRGGPRGGPDRRRGDRRAALVLGMVVVTSAPAGADVFTRRNAAGVFEATNLGGEGYKLAFRSKGVVVHSPGFRASAVLPGRYDAFVVQAAERERLDPNLLRAVMRVESAYDERAVSSAGARGLMQLMPDTASRFGVRDPFDPAQNIAGGAKYLAVLLRMFRQDVPLALAAYNAGEGNVMRYKGIPPFRETRDYVRKIEGLLGAPSAAAAAPTGMMTFTPGSEGRVSAAVATTPVSASGRRAMYRWKDAQGIVHVSETPPAGGVPFTELGR